MYQGGKKLSKLKIQKVSEHNIIKTISNIFKLKKENKAIKDRIIRDIKTRFEQQEEDYYKLTTMGNSDRNKNLSVKEYLNKIKPYLRDIINNLQFSDTWKNQLTIAINFISSKMLKKSM